MKTYKITTMISIAALLSGCATNLSYEKIQDYYATPKRIHSQHKIADSTARDLKATKTVKIGQALFHDVDKYQYEGIELLSSVQAQSTKWLKPNFTITPQNLVKAAVKGHYEYYVVQNHPKIKGQLKGLLPTFNAAKNTGIKVDTTDQSMQLFATNGRTEHVYAFPTEAKWNKITLTDLSKPVLDNTLVYLGKKDNNLLFKHIKIENAVNNNVLFSSNKANTTNKIITINAEQKSLNIDNRNIQILNANAQEINFGITKTA